ncbi:hypothetical protein [Geodermatophilus normandii]|uniref:hypothetical protein n=1 Tax=Geodermatophilus normandii TaxID=1137989 RepID=UPI000D70FED4|nr:hypothetical protein [Geodermatophilus normandii]
MSSAEGIDLWAEEHGDPAAPPLLLAIGADAGGLGRPGELADLLAAQHRVVRHDHPTPAAAAPCPTACRTRSATSPPTPSRCSTGAADAGRRRLRSLGV